MSVPALRPAADLPVLGASGWTSGWFFWEWYETPAYATVRVNAKGKVVFPLTVRWGDFEYHQMFRLRFDLTRSRVDAQSHGEDSDGWSAEGEPEYLTVDLNLDAIQPDLLFTHLSQTFSKVKLMTPKQAEAVAWTDFDDRPGDGVVWRPVDIGQAPEGLQWATDGELQIVG